MVIRGAGRRRAGTRQDRSRRVAHVMRVFDSFVGACSLCALSSSATPAPSSARHGPPFLLSCSCRAVSHLGFLCALLVIKSSSWSMTLPASVSAATALVKKAPRTASSTAIAKCLASKRHARSYSSSSLPRPYRFHVGAAWAGKPPDPRGPRVKSEPFPPDSPIGMWRDATLSRPNPGAGKYIGEDFFYIQDVSARSLWVSRFAVLKDEWDIQMREKSVRRAARLI